MSMFCWISSTALYHFMKESHIPEEVRRVTAEQEVNLYLTTQKDALQLKLQDGEQNTSLMSPL